MIINELVCDVSNNNKQQIEYILQHCKNIVEINMTKYAQYSYMRYKQYIEDIIDMCVVCGLVEQNKYKANDNILAYWTLIKKDLEYELKFNGLAFSKRNFQIKLHPLKVLHYLKYQSFIQHCKSGLIVEI